MNECEIIICENVFEGEGNIIDGVDPSGNHITLEICDACLNEMETKQ